MIQLAIKDLKIFFKDRRSVLLSFVVPIFLIVLFAYAFGGAGKGGNDIKVTLLVSDLDNTNTSQKAISILDTLKSLQIKPMPLDAAKRAIEKGDEGCVLVIHKGFSDSLNSGKDLPLELQYDASQGIQVGLIQQSLIPTVAMLPFTIGNPRKMMGERLSKMSGDTSSEKNIEKHSDELFDAISESMSGSKNENVNGFNSGFFSDNIKMTPLVKSGNDQQLGLIQAVAGTSVMMLLFAVVGIGMSLLDEKKEGTLKRMMFAPINPSTILMGKMISSNVIAVFQLLVMFIFTSIVFGLKIGPHLPGFLITIIATSFACSAFGVFLASFAQTRNQVQGLSTLIILVMSAVGGSMVPLFIMPELMQKMAVISVNYWSIQAFFDIFWRGLSVMDTSFLSKILVLVLIGGVLNFIAIILFRRNVLKD